MLYVNHISIKVENREPAETKGIRKCLMYNSNVGIVIYRFGITQLIVFLEKLMSFNIFSR